MQSDLVYQARAEILKALAHPSRLKVLEALEEGERCVCELQRLVGSDLSTVSRHLSVMRAAGIVSVRKQGSNAYYRLRVPCLLRLFGCIEAVLAAGARDRERLAKELAR